MDLNKFVKGDIIMGEITKHPIIFLGSKNEDEFYGCIITHSKGYENNIPLKEDFFLQKDDNKTQYKIIYDNSYLVKLKLNKKQEWGPFTKCGQLSNEGINYVNDNLKDLCLDDWVRYLEDLKK